MASYSFQKLSLLKLSSMQVKSAQNTLLSEDLYYLDNSCNNIENFKKGLIKIATIDLKDNSTNIDMYIQKSSQKRVILMRVKDKELFIVTSQWLDVL
jgi:Leucine-rich repeat (LRR) protein